MLIQIFHNPRCGKSRTCLKILQESGHAFEIIEYMKQTLTPELIQSTLDRLGINAEQLLRKNESIYKENFKDKKHHQNEWIKIMIAQPKLIQRPIIIKGDKAVIGRPIENLIEFLK